MSTKKTLQNLEEWGKTASDRDIQFQMLRIAVETRDKIETIRGIVSFLFALWLIGVILFLVSASSISAANAFG